MDLYLPAVPSLQHSFGTTVTHAQATIAVFLFGLAASQLIWAELLTRIGPRAAVQLGVGLLLITAVGCALAPTLEALLLARLIQGVAAGAATVIAPVVVRATLADADAVRGIASISMIEALVPAAGPVLGAALLAQMGWRGLFWVLSALTFLGFLVVMRVVPRELPGMDRSVDFSFVRILSNRKYLRLSLSHAFCVGALLTFVASAPQLMIYALGAGTSAFATLQVIGVAAFIVMASQSGRIARRIGSARAVQCGAWIQFSICALMLLLALTVTMTFALVATFWALFCGSLAVRGPSAFSEALAVPPAQMGRASAMLILALLLAGALGTQLVAPFLDGSSAAPLMLGMLALSSISLALVLPYPKAGEPVREAVPG